MSWPEVPGPHHDLLCRSAERFGGPVLVTGATGFVGANVVRALLDHRADVHIIVRPTSDLWRLQDVVPRLHVHVSDMTDNDGLDRAFSTSRPRVVLHFATPRGDGPDAGQRLQEEIVRGAEVMGRLVAEYSVERLIVTGSSLEYGPSDVPLEEDMCMAPTTAHGLAKARAASVLLQAATDGTSVCVLRLFHVYGPWESAHRFVPTILRTAYDGGLLPLTAAGIRRDWVYVDDVVDAVWRACGLEAPAEIINVGTGREYSNEEVVRTVERVTGRRLDTLAGAFPARPTDAAHRRADWSKAARLLGWSPRHDIDAGIRRTLDWWQTHPGVWAEMRGVPPVVC